MLSPVVVVNVDGSLVQHPLTCLGSFNREEEGWRRDNDWVWRRDGEEDEEIIWMMDEEEKKKGNSFLVNLEERTGGGIFTCHSLDKTLLKNTTVLVKHLDEEKRILEGSTRTGIQDVCLSVIRNQVKYCFSHSLSNSNMTSSVSLLFVCFCSKAL